MASNPMFYIDSGTSDDENYQEESSELSENRAEYDQSDQDSGRNNCEEEVLRNVETPLKDFLKVEVEDRQSFEDSLTSYRRKTSKYLTRQVRLYYETVILTNLGENLFFIVKYSIHRLIFQR